MTEAAGQNLRLSVLVLNPVLSSDSDLSLTNRQAWKKIRKQRFRLFLKKYKFVGLDA